MVDAHEAWRIGLVDEVVSTGELMERAGALALDMAAQAPRAMSEMIRVVDEGLDLPLDEGLKMEARAFGNLCETADKAEGTRAILEERQATWKGE